MEYVLTTSGLCKKYRSFAALNDVCMNVPKGSIYGFVGKNGAGKTTLIRVICGLQEPTDGTYSIYGISNQDKAIQKARGRMGAVVESPAIYLNMTARDNLKTQFRLLGIPSDEGIDELLSLVELEQTGDKKAGHFSLGMRQRLGIAIALAGNPDFLILDEPINGLDPEGIVEMRELLLKLNHEMKITILISSHILGELSKLATYYGFIDKGTIVKEISAEELENQCRKCTVIEVDNTQMLSEVLEKMGIEHRITGQGEVELYGDIIITEVVLKAAEKGCQITDIHTRNDTLETFYINLLGGGRHE